MICCCCFRSILLFCRRAIRNEIHSTDHIFERQKKKFMSVEIPFVFLKFACCLRLIGKRICVYRRRCLTPKHTHSEWIKINRSSRWVTAETFQSIKSKNRKWLQLRFENLFTGIYAQLDRGCRARIDDGWMRTVHLSFFIVCFFLFIFKWFHLSGHSLNFHIRWNESVYSISIYLSTPRRPRIRRNEYLQKLKRQKSMVSEVSVDIKIAIR